LLAYYGTKFILPQFNLYQYVASAVLAVFMAQFIYQMHGLFEMHFFAFIASTLLITYQNWRLQIPLVLLVVIHHSSLAYLQYLGVKDLYFTQLSYMDMQTFVIHVLLAAVIFFICGLWAYELERKTRQMVNNQLQLEVQLKSVRSNIAFAEEISRNNLHTNYHLEEEDELGKSLINMRDSLVQAAEREKQEKFTNVGTAQISEVLRMHAGDLSTLSYQVIYQLVKYMEANQGGFFIKQGEEEGTPHLVLMGCYAYERRKYLQKRIEIGEGLVGQAYLEKDAIFLTDIPNNYVNITSGLGKANPRCILLVPIQSNEEVVGVIELISFRPFQEFEIAFLNKIAESIAATIIAAQNHRKTAFLLEQAEIMTQQMHSQEEEMRQNMEELQATQEESERRLAEFESLLQEREEENAKLKQELARLQDIRA